MSNPPQKKGLGAFDFFCIGFGAIVGVGWSVSINNWMVNCGGPVPAAIGYLLVLILMVPIALCYCELVPMMPVAGGGMAFTYKAFNHHVAMVAGWMAFVAFVAIVPFEAIQITDILSYLIPQLKAGEPLYTLYNSEIYLSTIILGVLFSLLLFAINMRGLASAALFQKILCVILIASAVVGAIASLAGGRIENLQPIYDISNPSIYGEGLKQVTHKSMFGGCFSIVATAAFFLAGFETIPQGVEEAGGNIKSVGKTVVLSVTLACIFYAILLFSFGYGWPWQEFAGMDRPAAATMFLSLYKGKAIGMVLYIILLVGSLAGLFTTWNGFITPSANMLMAMARGRLIPRIFAKQNERGVAYYGQVLVLILDCCGPFLGPNLVDSITCYSGAAFMLAWSLTCWSLVRMRRRFPDMERPYKIPGGIATGTAAGIISAAAFICMFIPATPLYIGNVAVMMFGIFLAIGIVLYLASGSQRKGMSEKDLESGVFQVLEDES